VALNGEALLLKAISWHIMFPTPGVVPQVIAPHISSVTFSRDTPSSDLIHIEITAESESLYGDVAQVQGADIKLRN
jgi:hypothetical protein